MGGKNKFGNSFFHHTESNTLLAINQAPYDEFKIDETIPRDERLRRASLEASGVVGDITGILNTILKCLTQTPSVFFGLAPVFTLSERTDHFIRIDVFCGIWGFCGILAGTCLLMDKDNYLCQTSGNKFKAYSAILSGMSLFFTDNRGWWDLGGKLAGPTGLALPIFAATTLLDIISGTIDLAQATYENTRVGWLEERKKEITYLQYRLEREEDEKRYLFIKRKLRKMQHDISIYCRKSYQENITKNKNPKWLTVPGKLTQENNKIFSLHHHLACTGHAFDITKELSLKEARRYNEIVSEQSKNLTNMQKEMAQKILNGITITLFVISLFNPVTAPVAHLLSLAITCYVATKLIYKAYNSACQSSWSAKFFNNPIKNRPADQKLDLHRNMLIAHG